jgi:hypothetical protein
METKLPPAAGCLIERSNVDGSTIRNAVMALNVSESRCDHPHFRTYASFPSALSSPRLSLRRLRTSAFLPRLPAADCIGLRCSAFGGPGGHR